MVTAGAMIKGAVLKEGVLALRRSIAWSAPIRPLIERSWLRLARTMAVSSRAEKYVNEAQLSGNPLCP